jgi:hypothetical protein
MLPQLEALLQASPAVLSFHVIDNDPIDGANFLFKLRCELRSGRSLQIRLHAVSGNLRYSYQEFADQPLRLWDNAPHFPSLLNSPHHYHDEQGDVTESLLRGDPLADVTQVLAAL